MTERIASLDLIRGFALFGVLMVNAAYFAAPLAAVINPGAGPLAVSGATTWSWFVPYVFFEYKSMALFSMLFGASLYLVGGERRDPVGSRILRRRLGWLVVFGILHGALLWFGDILLLYALTGFAVMQVRSWTAHRLMAGGLVLFAASMALIAALTTTIANLSAAELEVYRATSWSPTAPDLAAQSAVYRQGWATAQLANFGAWIDFQIQTVLFLGVRTAGLMMVGLALFKSGFLSGRSRSSTYAACVAIGAPAMAVLVWNGWDLAQDGFPMVRMQTAGTLLTAGLAPLVAVAYAAGLALLLRAGAMKKLTAALAAVGRMAFTNYLVQSIVLGTVFWSGRGLGLHGSLSRPQVIAIAGALFVAQVLLSMLWLRRFEHGPFERVWRLASRGREAPRCGAPGPIAGLAIDSTDLVKRFGTHTAVAGIDLVVPAGAIYGFLGPNGAGKTTTIRMLLGLMRPSGGSVRVFGHDVRHDRVCAARQVGALLEARATYDHLTGRENLDITRRLLRLPPTEVDRVLSIVALRDAAGRKVGHYSLGMRQRLGLARALLGSPRLLLLDEPMNGLDPDGIADMRRTIRGLPDAAGVTVFLSSHLLAEVEQVATHVGLMMAGRLVAQDTLPRLLGRAAPDLLLRTGDDLRTREVLARAGFGSARGDGELVVAARGRADDAAAVARLLVDAGLAIHAMTPRSTDLEALYLSWSRKEPA